MYKTKYLFLKIVFFLFTAGSLHAQKGTQVSVWGGPQYVALVNVDDYLRLYDASKLNRLTTIRFGGGLDIIHNFTNAYGLQSGIYYSQQGQKYDGVAIKSSTDPGTRFTSHIYLNYLRVPLMLRFNSEFDDDNRMNLSIFAGMQLGFLRDVEEVKTTPGPADSLLAKHPNFDFKQLYKKTDLGLALGAQFNIKITSRIGTMIGIRYDRSFGTIEDKSFVLPKDAPEEWQYPVSTKKGVGGTDNTTRRPTRISAVNLYTGLTFNFGSAPKSTE